MKYESDGKKYRGRDGMVDITDLKSVGLVPWGFKSPRPHQNSGF